jgi:HK97 family phage prohead protease/HK97 family phage major capsid protein
MSKSIIDIPIDFKIKAVDSDDEVLQIEGFANTTTVDRVGDIILEEAWTKGGLDNYLKNPIILAYHNHDRPIGKMVDYAVNNNGLKITAEIIKSAGEVYSLIKSGVLKTFSVGFRTKDADYDTDTDLFVIKDLELMEVSVVSIPANADSIFSVKKSFETDEDYTSFKAEFVKDTSTVIAEEVSNDNSEIEEKIMPKTQAEIEAELRAKIEKEINDEAARKADLAKEVTSVVETQLEGTMVTVSEQVDGLKKEIEDRLADDSKTMQEALEGIQNQIKEYSEELQTLNTTSKMSFKDKRGSDDLAIYTPEQEDTAIIVSKILGRPVYDTNYGRELLEKSDGQHHTALTEDWEASFSMRLWDDIREKLIVENLFRVIQMPTVTLHLPLNPEAGYGTWVTTAQMNAATSSGTTRLHSPEDISITAHKLATKELLGYEEEDDSLIALVPLIRDAAVRRMAKSSDKALLIGDSGTAAAAGEGNYPFNGLAEIGIDDANTTTIAGTLASPTAVTVADMQAMRRTMGVHGHNPNDLVYVVNHDVYYDLLEDTDFRTMDLVGDKATIITGQVGAIAGTPVIVSGEFPAAAASNAAAVCVNMSNYLKGEYKSLRVERERSVENQTNLLVVTRRFGMIELFPANPTVHTLINPAA